VVRELSDRAAKMVALWNQGHPSSYIAKVMDLSRNTVIGTIHRAKYAGHYVRDGNAGAPVKARVPRKPRVRKPKPVPEEPIVAKLSVLRLNTVEFEIPDGPGRPIWTLKDNECRFPVGEGSYPSSVLFCGKPTEEDSSWCKKHRKRVYVTKGSL
jgi:hypothetical protein